MERKLNKKGQALGSLGTGILAVVIAVIVLVLGIIIVDSTIQADVVKKANTETHLNDSVVTVTETGEILNPSPGCQASVIRAIKAINATYVINSANYSVTDCKIRYVAGVNAQVNNTDWNVTYTYTYGGVAFVAGNTSIIGLDDFADFVPMIAIALAASVIIGLILTGFAFSRQR